MIVLLRKAWCLVGGEACGLCDSCMEAALTGSPIPCSPGSMIVEEQKRLDERSEKRRKRMSDVLKESEDVSDRTLGATADLTKSMMLRAQKRNGSHPEPANSRTADNGNIG